MRWIFLLSFGIGLICGVISMLVGVDRKAARPPGKFVLRSAFNLSTVGALLTVIGAVGYPMVRYTSLPTAVVVAIALIAGFAAAAGVFGLIAGWAMPSAAREVPDERYTYQGYVGRVTRAIEPGADGDISYQHDGLAHTVQARSVDGRPIPVGTEIVIERIEGGVAYVELWTTIERQLELPS